MASTLVRVALYSSTELKLRYGSVCGSVSFSLEHELKNGTKTIAIITKNDSLFVCLFVCLFHNFKNLKVYFWIVTAKLYDFLYCTIAG